MQTDNPFNTHFIPPMLPSLHEKHLFELNEYPLIDIQSCLKNMNVDQASLITILNMLIAQEFPNEIISYTQAHDQDNWGKIEKLAHKMKGGAIYTGLIRLQHACQHFEDYYQSGQSVLLEGLYQQIIYVMQETQETLEKLIASQMEK